MANRQQFFEEETLKVLSEQQDTIDNNQFLLSQNSELDEFDPAYGEPYVAVNKKTGQLYCNKRIYDEFDDMEQAEQTLTFTS